MDKTGKQVATLSPFLQLHEPGRKSNKFRSNKNNNKRKERKKERKKEKIDDWMSGWARI